MKLLKGIYEFLIILIVIIFITLIFLIFGKYGYIILILAFVVIKIFYSKLRGMMGEFWVNCELRKLSKEKYKVLNDIMLDINGNTYQIDHLVISSYGIFVIEMKNYYGYIFGNSYSDQWIQKLGKKRKYKYYFMNPIHQNYGHAKALENLLKLDSKCFIPIVCFSNQAKLSINTRDIVIKLDYLVSTISSFQNTIINQQYLDTICNKILEVNIIDQKERKRHIKNIKDKINDKNTKIDNMICPRCGSRLIVKRGKYGSFIGCSHYPLCRFTKK